VCLLGEVVSRRQQNPCNMDTLRAKHPEPAPSPFLCYSLTHAHRFIGYRNHNPQPLSESTTHPHRTMGYRNHNDQALRESVARLMYLRVSRIPHHTCGCVVNSPHNRTYGVRAVNVRLELVPRIPHRTCGCVVN
jgi:hypothetical protein